MRRGSFFIHLLTLLTFNTVFARKSIVKAKSFKLITTLYNETNKDRIREYITCMEYNLNHKYIESIHVLYDTSKNNLNDHENHILNYIKSKNIAITYIHGRPTYGMCFDLANRNYPNNRIILCNADIYFNDTLKQLQSYDLTNKFIALTRWNVQEDESIKPHTYTNGADAEYSQDVWIFKTPLKTFYEDTIQLGLPSCDGRIAYEARQSGLEVINPCLTIQCCHLHLSDIRNYVSGGIFEWNKMVSLSWTELK